MFSSAFWERYLTVFDEVGIVARTRITDAAAPPDGWMRVDGPSIKMIPLPDVVGAGQHLMSLRARKRAIRGRVALGDAVLGRAPSEEASLLLDHLPAPTYPFGLEVVQDPFDVFSRESVRHPLSPFFRWWATTRLRRQCARACAAAYVTQYALQQRYPPAETAYQAVYSSVELADNAFASGPRTSPSSASGITLMAPGSLHQMHKGFDILIDAAAALLGSGVPVTVRIVGDGRHRKELEQRAVDRGIAAHVIFVGELPAGEPMRQEYDRADLVVLPSRSEGLPRVILEAMARGVPCIGTRVGGIPELLDESELVPPGDVDALASKLNEVATNPSRMRALSERNLKTAHRYHEKVLQPRRQHFYRQLKSLTQAWLTTR